MLDRAHAWKTQLQFMWYMDNKEVWCVCLGGDEGAPAGGYTASGVSKSLAGWIV